MNKYAALTLTGLMLFSADIPQAQARCLEDDLRVVLSWYPQYLRRAPCPGGVRYWRCELRRGVSLEEIECRILAIDEYYAVYGRCPRTWIRGMLVDVLGRPACPRTAGRLVRRFSRCGCRKTIAQEVLAMKYGGGPSVAPAIVEPPVVVERPPVVVPQPGRVRVRAPRFQPPVNVIVPQRRVLFPVPRPGVRVQFNIPFGR